MPKDSSQLHSLVANLDVYEIEFPDSSVLRIRFCVVTQSIKVSMDTFEGRIGPDLIIRPSSGNSIYLKGGCSVLSKNLAHPNPIVVWDVPSAAVLRPASDDEVRRLYAQDESPDGGALGYPGRQVWLARQDPTATILGWCPDGTPIYRDWTYPTRSADGSEGVYTDAEALDWAHRAKDATGTVGGVWCDVSGDPGGDVPPEPLLRAWRALWPAL